MPSLKFTSEIVSRLRYFSCSKVEGNNTLTIMWFIMIVLITGSLAQDYYHEMNMDCGEAEAAIKYIR